MEPEGRAAQLTRAQDELSRVESEIARVGDMLAQDLGARSERAHGRRNPTHAQHDARGRAWLRALPPSPRTLARSPGRSHSLACVRCVLLRSTHAPAPRADRFRRARPGGGQSAFDEPSDAIYRGATRTAVLQPHE